MLLSVVIVNYNVKYFLEQCLCSLQAALANIEAEVLVIDNCSQDDSIDYLQPLFPLFTFIKNNTNEGFAKANNKALQLAKGEHVLFLNPDTILAEDTLQQCLNFFANHSDTGAVGVRMIDGTGTFLPESKRAFPAPLTSFYKLTGLAALFPKSTIFNRYALGFLPEQAVQEVDVLAGAFMMIKKTALDKMDGFDERFFMYAEDIDLSYRIKKGGYKNYYLGTVTIVHFKGESTAKGSLNYVRMFYQAMRLFVKKHYSGAGAWVMNKVLYTGILLRQIIAALALPLYKKSIKINKLRVGKIYTMGDKLQNDVAMNIIKKNDPTIVIQRVKNNDELQAFTKETAIVFCTGGSFTYKEAIQLSQTFSKNILLLWCGKNSCSMAGSNDKNTSGFVWC